MPPTPKRVPNELPRTLSVRPLTRASDKPRPGRPRKLGNAPLPDLEMSAGEKELFDYFIRAHREEYPDLSPTDHLNLFLAGIEYIKYCRMAQEELATGTLISMARQHPGTQYARLMDMLSVTRKARKKDKVEAEDDDFTTNLWKPA